MTNNQIKKYASDFRKGLLKDYPSESMCFVVTSPLATLLILEGIQCELTEGMVGKCHHFWIEFPNGNILDPTADQFKTPEGQDMPKVYIGQLPEWYKIKAPERRE